MSILARVKSFFGLRKTSDGPELASIVLLLSEPLSLSEQDLKATAIKAWDRDLMHEANEYVALKSGGTGRQVGFIHFDQMVMLVNNFSQPYIPLKDLPEILSNTREMRTHKALKEHTSWLSFDLMEPKLPRRKEKQLFYCRASALAAEFVGSNCLAVVFPETNELRPYDNLVKEALQAKNPLSALRQWNPVPLVDDQDLRMDEAMAEARRRWPECKEAFRNRRSGQRFVVKAPFRAGEESEGEWMWIEILALSGDIVEGKLLNKPVHNTSVHEGEIVRIPTSTIGDWMYNDGKKAHGGFTDAVLRMQRR